MTGNLIVAGTLVAIVLIALFPSATLARIARAIGATGYPKGLRVFRLYHPTRGDLVIAIVFLGTFAYLIWYAYRR